MTTEICTTHARTTASTTTPTQRASIVGLIDATDGDLLYMLVWLRHGGGVITTPTGRRRHGWLHHARTADLGSRTISVQRRRHLFW